MLVYRITKTKFASKLIASGFAGRWNNDGEGMIYTGGSASLSCLEILAHKSGAALLSGDFSIAVIEIAETAKIHELQLSQIQKINKEWFKVLHYPITQKLGSRWLSEKTAAILKVPSAIVDREYNYLINPLHPDFEKIKVLDITAFSFVTRLKMNI